MQVQIETLDGLKRQMIIGLPWLDYEMKMNTQVQKLSKEVKIPGFRPGKVPEKIVRQRYGDALKAEVLSELIRNSYIDAIEEHDVKVAGLPQFEPPEVTQGEPLEFKATFEVYPEIELKDLSGETIEKITAEVKDADLDEALDGMRKQHMRWNEVEREAKDGDQLDIDFTGYIDDEAFEGGKAEHFEIVIGSKSMIPGFEEGLLGAKAGEERDIQVKFPDDYHSEQHAGKDAKFAIKIHAVKESSLPELDDELAKEFGVAEGGVEKLKEEVKATMEKELGTVLKSKLKEKIFDKLLEKNDILLPSALVDQEMEHLQENMKKDLQRRYGTDDLPDFPKESFEESAKRRVGLGLLVHHMIELFELKADPERVNELLQERANMFQNPEMVAYLSKHKEFMDELQSLALEEQVIDKLLENAVVEEQNVSYSEAMQPEKSEADEAENE